jgi:hypothetical protein
VIDLVGPDVAEISKSELRRRAVDFSQRWRGVQSEQAESTTFWNEFFAIFGVERRQVALFEGLVKRASTGGDGRVDLLYPNQMAVEHKSAGKDLDVAMQQLVDYLPHLRKELAPWLLVVCNFDEFRWRNLENDTSGSFPLDELSLNLELFWWIGGHAPPSGFPADDEEAVNLAATDLLRVLYEEIAATSYPIADLREWLTRILFCLFADDTDVWPRAAFHAYLASTTRDDGSDLGRTLAEVFQVLDTPHDERDGVDEDLKQLEHIGGDLFERTLRIPVCTKEARAALLEACRFNWSAISPAIFGAMFQNVMTADERHQIGAHYTTERDILRTIGPSFVDELDEQLRQATSVPKLRALHDRLAQLTFFDPACGCGNFLVIAYREIRRIETEIIRRLGRKSGQTEGQRAVDIELLCRVEVDQFFGIEIEEFPARIARTALYLIDHMANRTVSVEFGQQFNRFPIPASPHIYIGNALEVDWEVVLGSRAADFLFGNPPFVDRKERNTAQKDDHELIHGTKNGVGSLDYVAGWFVKAAQYLAKHGGRAAFVATNSITQGVQVAPLWSRLFAARIEIDFAHRSFAWTSEAKGKAHVHVVIVGFSVGGRPGRPRLFDYPDPTDEPVDMSVASIGPYLTPGPPTVVRAVDRPLVPGIPASTYGCTAGEGGHLLFDHEQVAAARSDPVASAHLREYLGADELFSAKKRWVLWLDGVSPEELRSSAFIRERLSRVRAVREGSTRPGTKKAAGTPWLLLESRPAHGRYLFVPCVSSERREYAPMAFRGPDTIVRASSWFIEGADTYLFGMLQSAMFMAWVRNIGGRLESRLQIGGKTVYNTFPFPDPSAPARRRVVDAAEAVLDARDEHPDTPLGVLYDPLVMPLTLRSAHLELDAAVDAAVAPRSKFATEGERLALLLDRYRKLVSPLEAAAAPAKRRRR